MTTLVIKNFPGALHARLKEQAQRHRRSLTQEVVTVIEQALMAPLRRTPQLSPPIKLKGGPITIEEIEAAINHGRD